MVTGDIVMLVVLNELVDSDDEKPRRGKHVIGSNKERKRVTSILSRNSKLKIDSVSEKCSEWT